MEFKIHEEELYGVYIQQNNRSYGFWLISPGRAYYCGDNMKQELLVHRKSSIRTDNKYFLQDFISEWS